MDSLNTEEVFKQVMNVLVTVGHTKKNNYPLLMRTNLKSILLLKNKLNEKYLNEAMVQWNQNKYSVPVNYIGKILTLRVKEDKLYIYDDSTLIRTPTITHQLLNYHRNDYIEILCFDVFKHLEDEELEHFVDENLQAYDER
ncbi:hypothetical protein ACMDZ4_002631 [Enterococcus faecalis]